MSTKTLSRKQVRETSAGKSIDAWVILNPAGKHVATVQSCYLESGSVMVDVWDSRTIIHQGKANGGGYDKFTAALAGAVIDGIKIYNHSETDHKTAELLPVVHTMNYDQANDFLKGTGFEGANWNSALGHYASVYPISGLDRLEDFGYKVIKAI